MAMLKRIIKIKGQKPKLILPEEDVVTLVRIKFTAMLDSIAKRDLEPKVYKKFKFAALYNMEFISCWEQGAETMIACPSIDNNFELLVPTKLLIRKPREDWSPRMGYIIIDYILDHADDLHKTMQPQEMFLFIENIKKGVPFAINAPHLASSIVTSPVMDDLMRGEHEWSRIIDTKYITYTKPKV